MRDLWLIPAWRKIVRKLDEWGLLDHSFEEEEMYMVEVGGDFAFVWCRRCLMVWRDELDHEFED